MIKRIHNFCAGPCMLPLDVLEEAQSEFVDFHGAGMSLLEMSHRSKEYDAIHYEAMSLATELYQAPKNFKVLFIQGGASLQFAMVPMNFLIDGQKGAYLNTGSWGKAAIRDGRNHGSIYIAWDGEPIDFMRMPVSSEMELSENTRYLHVTSNETIGGIRVSEWPDVAVPLVVDMSSDYMSRPVPWEKFDLVYGGAQKNLGPAGMSIVFIRESLLASTNRKLANYLRYDIHAAGDSLFNTPPVFVIYMFGKVMKWMKENGGLVAMERAAEKKSGKLYEVIDDGNYYHCPVNTDNRSHMNVVFKLPNVELEGKFLAEAAQLDFVNLKGHRSVGGCRASIYNAMPMASVEALAEFMAEFRRING